MAAIKGEAEFIVVKRESGLQKRLDAAFRGKAKTPSSALTEEHALGMLYANARVVAPPFDPDQFGDFYERCDVFGSCIDHIVDNVAGMGHEIIPKTKPRSGSDVTPVPANGKEPSPEQRQWLIGVFDEPNTEGLAFTKVLKRWLRDRLTLGNGFLEVTRDGGGRIDGFHHLPARTMRVRLDRQGKVENYVQVVGNKTQDYRKYGDVSRRYAVMERLKAGADFEDDERDRINKAGLQVPREYRRNIVLKALRRNVRELSEVHHELKYSPRRGVYGMPLATSVFEDMVGLAAYKLYNADFFENGTIPPLIIIIRGGLLADNTRDDIKGYLETEGRQEYHKIAIISTDEDTELQIERLAAELQSDASYLGYAEQAQKNVAMRHRVPYSQLTESSSRAPGQAEQDSIRFREQVVRPMQRDICVLFNGLFLPNMGVTDWELKLLEGDLTEMTARATACERGLRRGALQLNEYRSIVHDLPPMEDGDVAFVIVPGVGLVPVELIKGLLEQFEAGQGSLPELIRLQTPTAGGDNGDGERIRTAGKKAGIDEDLLEEALEDAGID